MNSILLKLRNNPLALSITTILGLSVLFLGTILLFDYYNIDIDSEIVFVALVPIIIALLITGKLVISEIQTPWGKFLLEPLSKSPGPSTTPIEDICDFHGDNEIIDVSEYISSESKELKLSDEEKETLKKYIQDKRTKILLFQLGQVYATDLIRTCMEAIAEDSNRSIRYITFVSKRGEFEGLLKISNAFHNRLLLAAMSEDENWTGLVDDIKSREVLEYPGTVRDTIRLDKTPEDALRKMDEVGYNWIPVVNEKHELKGVVSENQIVRDILLASANEK